MTLELSEFIDKLFKFISDKMPSDKPTNLTQLLQSLE